jgi:hypothetical protein
MRPRASRSYTSLTGSRKPRVAKKSTDGTGFLRTQTQRPMKQWWSDPKGQAGILSQISLAHLSGVLVHRASARQTFHVVTWKLESLAPRLALYNGCWACSGLGLVRFKVIRTDSNSNHRRATGQDRKGTGTCTPQHPKEIILGRSINEVILTHHWRGTSTSFRTPREGKNSGKPNRNPKWIIKKVPKPICTFFTPARVPQL